MKQTGIVSKFFSLYKLVDILQKMGMNDEQIRKFMESSMRQYWQKKARELVQKALDKRI